MDLKLSSTQNRIDSINDYFNYSWLLEFVIFLRDEIAFQMLEIASPKDFPDCLSNMCISSIPYAHVYV